MKQYKKISQSEQLKGPYSQNLQQNIQFFTNHQGVFRGEKRTYTPREGQPMYDKLQGYIKVTTTVKERLDYFVELGTPFIKAYMDVESTNAKSGKKVPLIVEDVLMGEFTAMELMRLLSIIQNPELTKMYSNIPVRSETTNWYPSELEEYLGKQVFETLLISSEKRTSENTQRILDDPNLERLTDQSAYRAQVVTVSQTIIEGDATMQQFSGEATHSYRSKILYRLSKLKQAISDALADANDVEAIPSELDVKKLFDYLHNH